jgi:hypothetical protein
MTKKKMPKVTLYYDEKPKEIYLEKKVIESRGHNFANFMIFMCCTFWFITIFFYSLLRIPPTDFTIKMLLFGNGYCIASFLFALMELSRDKVYYKQVNKEEIQKC